MPYYNCSEVVYLGLIFSTITLNTVNLKKQDTFLVVIDSLQLCVHSNSHCHAKNKTKKQSSREILSDLQCHFPTKQHQEAQ